MSGVTIKKKNNIRPPDTNLRVYDQIVYCYLSTKKGCGYSKKAYQEDQWDGSFE